MANLKASKKNTRRIAVQTARNRKVKSTLKTLVKKVNVDSSSDNKEAAKAAAVTLVSAIDKAAKRNIVHPNKAARIKSAMAKHIFSAS